MDERVPVSVERTTGGASPLAAARWSGTPRTDEGTLRVERSLYTFATSFLSRSFFSPSTERTDANNRNYRNYRNYPPGIRVCEEVALIGFGTRHIQV